MRQFAIKIFLLLVPVLLIYGFPVVVLVTSGELLPLFFVTLIQNNNRPFLFGLAYSNPVNSYKLQSANLREPQVLALGTSRVMQFRGAFFRNPEVFYNAGGTYARFDEFRIFLSKLDYAPKVVIVGVDQYFFNDNWRRTVPATYDTIDISDKRDFLGIITTFYNHIYSDYKEGKFTLSDLFQHSIRKKIGLQAIANDAGFRNDGSYDYGKTIREDRFREVFNRIASRTKQFQRGEGVSLNALRELEDLLDLCFKKNIHVVGFLPPYPHAIWKKMMLAADDFDYMRHISGQVKPLFDRYAFSFFDFSDLADLGAADNETIDGVHCSETAYLRIFIQMQRVDKRLQAYSLEETDLTTRLDNRAPPSTDTTSIFTYTQKG